MGGVKYRCTAFKNLCSDALCLFPYNTNVYTQSVGSNVEECGRTLYWTGISCVWILFCWIVMIHFQFQNDRSEKSRQMLQLASGIPGSKDSI